MDATAEIIHYIDERTSPDTPFDFIHAGFSTGDPLADSAKVQEYGDVGVTWWLEHVYPSRMTPAKLRAFTSSGPPAQT